MASRHIKRDGFIYEQRFENGGKPVTTLEKIGKTNQTGTTIHFKPDPTIFSTTTYNYETFVNDLRESAFLLKGLKLKLMMNGMICMKFFIMKME